MVRGLGFIAGLTVLIALVLLVPPTYCSKPPCAHSCSCGSIPNISFPFRLSTDPENCGDSRYELLCENNHHCAPSSCGNIPNISFPFRLKTDPKKCGSLSKDADALNMVRAIEETTTLEP
ncbi:hypothetical protein CFP56_006117 [Quercus suber]|uniref:Wall-associated receptor kinase galacturonan-binding domain-containing protein n=1 Tax=Quercus suber TaxID=58331 RepID=A0AAW0LBZ1_QUESU